MTGGEGREEAGGEADTWLVAGLDQEDLLWESQAGSSLAEGQVGTGGDGEGAEQLGKVVPGLESAEGQEGLGDIKVPLGDTGYNPLGLP